MAKSDSEQSRVSPHNDSTIWNEVSKSRSVSFNLPFQIIVGMVFNAPPSSRGESWENRAAATCLCCGR